MIYSKVLQKFHNSKFEGILSDAVLVLNGCIIKRFLQIFF